MKIATMLNKLPDLVAGMLLAVLAAMPTPAAHAQGCSGDLNGDGRIDGADLATLLVNWGTCPATVSSVSPTQGSVLGGSVITLTGTSLAATSAVTIGGAPCTNLQVLSATQVRATTPPGASGPAAVGITTPAGTSLAPTPFTYVVQSVASIIPSSGLYQGGTPITITGQYLAGTTAVTIGGVPATNVIAVNSTTVTALTPAGSIGAADVVVTGPKGSVTVPGGFAYLSVIVPAWATMIEALPDPAVVTSATLRNAISATGYAWRVRDNGTGIEMVLIPPGTFNMGCSASFTFPCTTVELPIHQVTISAAFYLARFEVTQAQWMERMGTNPSYFQSPSAQVPADQVPHRPVDSVSWNVVAGTGGFLNLTGLRLPTEAEWEYAYRAGTLTAFHGFEGQPSGTDDDSLIGIIAWYSGNSEGQTHPVGRKAANGFGIYDMAGNASEWVNDWYSSTYYQSSPALNPTGPTSGTLRVLRGGSWADSSTLRASRRGYHSPSDGTGPLAGFRVARNP